ncbi:Protein RnfH [Halomonadaceae bacterium LMG 33818]|uniref:RnfH family protein n=1 Tax=Cernens ardua TaxID=3402176 RepID=UPI003EDBDF40
MGADINNDVANIISIEIAYVSGGCSCLIAMKVVAGTTVQEAYQQFLLNLDENQNSLEWLYEAPLGIFGQRIKSPESYVLDDGDRIEAYAPLKVDPKAARRTRAGH